jgi:hypothetical protein
LSDPESDDTLNRIFTGRRPDAFLIVGLETTGALTNVSRPVENKGVLI